jgi:hypothetical protein
MDSLKRAFFQDASKLAGLTKLANNSALIVTGMLIGSTVNAQLKQHGMQAHFHLRPNVMPRDNTPKPQLARECSSDLIVRGNEV